MIKQIVILISIAFSQTVFSQNIVGEYYVTGTNSKSGGKYSGTCNIKLYSNSSYGVTWIVLGKKMEKYQGIGMLKNDTLIVKQIPKISAIEYCIKLNGEFLEGKYVNGNGEETLKKKLVK